MLLETDGNRGVPVLQSLVLNHLLVHDDPAVWVNVNGHATTTTLAQLAPSRRLLDRIHIARGFIAYQHYGAVCDLSSAVTRSSQESPTDDSLRGRQPPKHDGNVAQTPSLIVAPAVDATYRAADTLSEAHTKTLQARTLARLATHADWADVSVVVTRSKRDDVAPSIAGATGGRRTAGAARDRGH